MKEEFSLTMKVPPSREEINEEVRESLPSAPVSLEKLVEEREKTGATVTRGATFCNQIAHQSSERSGQGETGTREGGSPHVLLNWGITSNDWLS